MKSSFKIIIASLCALLFQTGLACHANTVQGPTYGNISSLFGMRVDPFTGEMRYHHGLDIACPAGTPIYAMQDGFVIFSGQQGGYGNVVIIDHYFSDIPELPRVQTKYAHNSKNLVKKGDYVRRGQIIAEAGSTGRSTGPHLHFEVIYQGQSINPLEYLTKLPTYLDYAAKVRESRRYATGNRYNGIGGY